MSRMLAKISKRRIASNLFHFSSLNRHWRLNSSSTNTCPSSYVLICARRGSCAAHLAEHVFFHYFFIVDMTFHPFQQRKTTDAVLENKAKFDARAKHLQQEGIASGKYTSAGIMRYQRNKSKKWLEQHSHLFPLNVSSIAPSIENTAKRPTCPKCGSRVESASKITKNGCSIICRMKTKGLPRAKIIETVERRIALLIEQGKKLDANFEKYLEEHDPTLEIKQCPSCHAEFRQRFNNQDYCSIRCRKREQSRKRQYRRMKAFAYA